MPFAEALAELKAQGTFQTDQVEFPRLVEVDYEKVQQLIGLATENLRSYLDTVNVELLNGRGSSRTTWSMTQDGENYEGGLVLEWDRNGPAGRRLEMGVRSGSFQQIYMAAGDCVPVIFTSLKDFDGSERKGWQEAVEKEILELLNKHHNYLEYSR